MKLSRLLLLGCLLLVGCKKQHESPVAGAVPASQPLYIYALQSFRSSGLEAVLIPEFERQQQCEIRLSLFESGSALVEAIKAQPDTLDLVLGIDNIMAAADQLWPYFTSFKAEDFPFLSRECITDPSYRLIPYAYSYVALLYNTRLIASPPKSFGELQDAKYYRQIALCDPQSTAWGAAFMHYVISLFGEAGYEQVLAALRKNVCRSYSDTGQALTAVQNGECSMMFAMFSTASWMQELQPAQLEIKTQIFKEGSFLYTESIALTTQSKQKAPAQAFIAYMLSEAAQKMILYKSSLLPSHKKVMLPQSYSHLPLSVYALNDRLDRDFIVANHSQWLETWTRLLGSGR